MVAKTILSRSGYSVVKASLTETQLSTLRADLTVKPFVSPGLPAAVAFPVYSETDDEIRIPKVYGLKAYGPVTENALDYGVDALGLVFEGSLRPEQLNPVNAFIASAANPLQMGGIVSLYCGGGKTICALYIASVYKKQTLIIVHKDFLLQQWRERIGQFLPAASIGGIKQKVVDVVGRDIVIASLQSLAMRDYSHEIFAGFGMVILDECHHLGAEVFSRALGKVTTKVTLGLSATVKRKDGLSKVFEWHIGKPVFSSPKREDSGVEVHIKNFYDPHPDYGRERFMANRKLNTAAMINAVCAYPPRLALVLNSIRDIKAKDPARKILILSNRRNHLDKIAQAIGVAGIAATTTGFYVGGMKQEALKASEDADVILATFSMASEGFDCPALDTLILASPISSIEQSVGRILRQKAHERRHIPLVIDILDNFSIFQRQGAARRKFFEKQGYSLTVDGVRVEKGCDSDSDNELKKTKEAKEKGPLKFRSDDDE